MSLMRRFLRSYICKILCITFFFSLGIYANPINLYSANNVFSTKAIKAIELLLNSDGENNFTTGDNDIAYITGPLSIRDVTGDVYIVIEAGDVDITGDINFTGTLYENGAVYSGGGATYREITLLPEAAILDDNIFPTISVKESSGTGTPRFRVASFDDGTDDTLYWNFVAPSDTTTASDWYADVYSYSDEDVDEDVLWSIQISATSNNDADNVEEQAADTASVAVENYDKTEAKALCICTITMDSADIDNVAAGDDVTVIFKRDGDDASDDHTNNEVYLKKILLKIPRSN